MMRILPELEKQMLRCMLGAVVILAPFAESFAQTWLNFTNKNSIVDVAAGPGVVWCATTGGALRFDLATDRIDQFTTAEGLGGTSLLSVAVDTSGTVWFGGNNGTLTKYEARTNRWTVFPFIDRDNRKLKLKDIFIDGNKLWMATDVGVILFDAVRNGGEIRETYRRLGTLQQEAVNAVLVKDGRIWAAAVGGVVWAFTSDPNLLDPARWHTFTKTTGDSLQGDQYQALAAFDSTVFVGSEAGLFRLVEMPADTFWQVLPVASDLIRALHAAGDSLFFSGRFGLGVVTRPGLTVSFLNSDPLGTRIFPGLAMATDGRLFIATQGKGLGIYRNQTYQRRVIDGPPENFVVDVALDRRGRVWIANWNSGFAMYDGTWHTFDTLPVAPLGWAVTVDLQDNVWCCSWGGGIYEFTSDGRFRAFTSANSPVRGIASTSAYTVSTDAVVDFQGNVWFTNPYAYDSTALLAFRPDSSWEVFYKNARDGLVSNDIVMLYPQDDHIWIGYKSAGTAAGVGDFNFNGTLGNHADDILVFYNQEREKLLSNTVTAIAIDRTGVLWVGTTAGLQRFDPDLRRFIGVQMPSPLGPQVNAITIDARNNKWIGTSTGLGLITPDGQFRPPILSTNSGLVSDAVAEITLDPLTGDLWIAAGSPLSGEEGGLSRFRTGFGGTVSDLKQVEAYPNPFVLESGRELLTFKGLPFEATVTIYNVAGDRIWRRDRTDQWDGRNEGGELVAGGIYLFVATAPGKEPGVGKVAVIRK